MVHLGLFWSQVPNSFSCCWSWHCHHWSIFPCCWRQKLEGNRSEWGRGNLVPPLFIFPLLSLELPHHLPQISCVKIYLDCERCLLKSSLNNWVIFQRSSCLACFKTGLCLVAIIICFSYHLLFQLSYSKNVSCLLFSLLFNFGEIMQKTVRIFCFL